MSLTSQLPTVLEHHEFLEQVEALKESPSLSQMVYIVLQMGLYLARWLLEDELSRRAKQYLNGLGVAPAEPACTRRDGNLVRCRHWWEIFTESDGWVVVQKGVQVVYQLLWTNPLGLPLTSTAVKNWCV
ncbi:hypothetical protein [Acaryochloris sp. CCMEE 5410]|uniref:hypothetical protein n=1 Tax=Acaryochloris sp. CCMEE 5410 TaxID=310037 RepID=UPI0021CF1E0A|nr:hypothetical protein [Acaryochloris sp. CCMEE 5410]KAI9131213.1 hypothetical protein ON05_026545 [Acaryochloris sp. CCMEE 5410]KAI9131670.1 hypothetical protein ON05_029255 [Acaryochloris sp. CCMEE 5410]KAI9132112.1 hypothetical protein ON05_001015 [Acaryochloris sp. CCMEE 5410]KAI9132620.1 hypothetical protein ON05_004130 [Acaryochloris sp. CCMEE 5410]KAI9134344.1 hypothetical protein ON05_014355 [Acaryochloris sp. CCMEE 5410]